MVVHQGRAAPGGRDDQLVEALFRVDEDHGRCSHALQHGRGHVAGLTVDEGDRAGQVGKLRAEGFALDHQPFPRARLQARQVRQAAHVHGPALDAAGPRRGRIGHCDGAGAKVRSGNRDRCRHGIARVRHELVDDDGHAASLQDRHDRVDRGVFARASRRAHVFGHRGGVGQQVVDGDLVLDRPSELFHICRLVPPRAGPRASRPEDAGRQSKGGGRSTGPPAAHGSLSAGSRPGGYQQSSCRLVSTSWTTCHPESDL